MLTHSATSRPVLVAECVSISMNSPLLSSSRFGPKTRTSSEVSGQIPTKKAGAALSRTRLEISVPSIAGLRLGHAVEFLCFEIDELSITITQSKVDEVEVERSSVEGIERECIEGRSRPPEIFGRQVVDEGLTLRNREYILELMLRVEDPWPEFGIVEPIPIGEEEPSAGIFPAKRVGALDDRTEKARVEAAVDFLAGSAGGIVETQSEDLGVPGKRIAIGSEHILHSPAQSDMILSDSGRSIQGKVSGETPLVAVTDGKLDPLSNGSVGQDGLDEEIVVAASFHHDKVDTVTIRAGEGCLPAEVARLPGKAGAIWSGCPCPATGAGGEVVVVHRGNGVIVHPVIDGRGQNIDRDRRIDLRSVMIQRRAAGAGEEIGVQHIGGVIGRYRNGVEQVEEWRRRVVDKDMIPINQRADRDGPSGRLDDHTEKARVEAAVDFLAGKRRRDR